MVRAADAAASFLLVKMGHVLGLKEYLGNDSSPLLQKILYTAALFKLHCLTANSKLARANLVRVKVEYFVICDDEENAAYQVKGQYVTVTGIVMRVDAPEQHLTVQSETGKLVIPFSDIYRISAAS